MGGARDGIASLIGKAKQRLDAQGRSELTQAIRVMPWLGGELTPDLVAEALTTVRVHEGSPWGGETVGETMPAVHRRELPRPQSQKPGTKTAEPFADTG